MSDEAMMEHNNMQQILRQTDYVALKLAEGAASPQEYAEILQQRQACRDRLSEWDGENWVETFEGKKCRKVHEIGQAYNVYVHGSFVCSLGYPMQFNESDGVKMEGAIKLLVASGGTAGYLTDANDDTHYDVPLADMQAVHFEMLTKYAEAHAKKQLLRQQIKAAATEEDLARIQW